MTISSFALMVLIGPVMLVVAVRTIKSDKARDVVRGLQKSCRNVEE